MDKLAIDKAPITIKGPEWWTKLRLNYVMGPTIPLSLLSMSVAYETLTDVESYS